MNFTPADISVVIPSYNSSATIAGCLESLRQQNEPPCEVIVVDSSDDGTPELIASRFPEVKVRHYAVQTFPGPARNIGAKGAKGAIIAFTDADCLLQPDWLQRIARAHSEGHKVVGGAIEVGNLSSLTAWAGHLGEFREFLPVGEAHPVLHIPTCNISYRRQLFNAQGGFPIAYYPQEDLLFNYLLNQEGCEVWFEPQLRIRHFCREGLHDYLSHQHRIGRVTRSTLRRINMPGSNIARRAWLAWLAAPVLGVVKFFRTASLFNQHYAAAPVNRPALLALLALGSLWWARGFAASARKGLSGIKGWDDPDEPIFAQLSQSAVPSDQKRGAG